MEWLVCIFTLLCFVSGSIGKPRFGPGEQEWGYVKVRPHANMFWWLYYTTADVKSYYDKPLIIWLQGGPGGSSAYGNFEVIGPLDLNLNPRNNTWVKSYNVLFIDNPVGTGFSYVNNTSAFATTNSQIASDLLECMRGFYDQLPKFKSVPTYITTESYGGKMGAEFALVWARAQKAGNIESNLKGIALGDAWISPIDSVITWPQFLFDTGMIDLQCFQYMNHFAKLTEATVNMDEWIVAFTLWEYTANLVLRTTFVNFYNIMVKKQYSGQQVMHLNKDFIYGPFIQRQKKLIDIIMEGPVKEALGLLEVNHDYQAKDVFRYLREDFMKPTSNIVELLLNETNLNVYVYNGVLDLIVSTPGTLRWVEKLKWKKADIWKYNSIRKPLVVEGIVEGYVKAADNFAMYWVSRAGHNVPMDNPAAMEMILQDLTSHKQVNESKN